MVRTSGNRFANTVSTRAVQILGSVRRLHVAEAHIQQGGLVSIAPGYTAVGMIAQNLKIKRWWPLLSSTAKGADRGASEVEINVR